MLGTSDAWLTSHLSQRTSKPAYYIVGFLGIKQIGKKIQKATSEKMSNFFLFQSISMAIQFVLWVAKKYICWLRGPSRSAMIKTLIPNMFLTTLKKMNVSGCTT